MPLTLTQCSTLISLSLGGGSLPTGLTASMLVNQAGRWLASYRAWKWLERPLATVSLVEDESYAALPSDFGELIAAPEYLSGVGVNATGTAVQLTSISEILSAREQDTEQSPPDAQFWAAIVYAPPDEGSGSSASSGSSGEEDAENLVARLEVWPTPSDDGSFRIAYRAKWVAVSAGADRLVMPHWMDATFIEVLRAFARGAVREDDAGGTLSERLAKIAAGPVFMAAVRQDGMAQPYYGPLTGGAAMMYGGRVDFRYGGLAPPS